MKKDDGLFITGMLFGILIGLLFMFLMFFFNIFGTAENNGLYKNCNCNASIYNYLDVINDNCGSTFVTKKLFESSWYIFAEKCNLDGYCKSSYIPIEDCLK